MVRFYRFANLILIWTCSLKPRSFWFLRQRENFVGAFSDKAVYDLSPPGRFQWEIRQTGGKAHAEPSQQKRPLSIIQGRGGGKNAVNAKKWIPQRFNLKQKLYEN